MPKRTLKLSPQSSVLIAAGCFLLILLALVLATNSVAAQEATTEPTSEFSASVPPTLALPPETPGLQILSSLTGVNGQAVSSNVAIRSGPGLTYPRIGFLAQGRWIDIIGWSGWKIGRVCSSNFSSDLDMWVQVQAGEGRGWIARCTLLIRGQLTDLPIVSASGARTLQR